MRFFFYGTLLDRDVTALVLGRRLPPSAFEPAMLRGHSRRRARGVSYPVVVRDPRGEVSGAIWLVDDVCVDGEPCQEGSCVPNV